MKKSNLRYMMFLWLCSMMTASFAQNSFTSHNGQLLKGVPKACYRIIGPFKIDFRSEPIDSDGPALNSPQRIKLFRSEIVSQIQGMLERFEIPITPCAAESFKSVAQISITVDFIDGIKDDGQSKSSVGTMFFDFVKSIHTNETKLVALSSSQHNSNALPYDEVVDHTLDEIRLQLLKLAREFRRQNVH